MRVFDSNWMQIADYLERDDRDRASDRLDGAARVPLAGNGRAAGRAGVGGGGGAARRAGAAGPAVRHGAVLHRVPGQHEPADRHLRSARCATCSTASPARVSGASWWSTATAATRRSPAHPRVGLPSRARSPGAGAVPQLVTTRRRRAEAALPVRRRPVPRLLAGELPLDQGRRSRDPQWQRRRSWPAVDGERRDRARQMTGAAPRRQAWAGLYQRSDEDMQIVWRRRQCAEVRELLEKGWLDQ